MHLPNPKTCLSAFGFDGVCGQRILYLEGSVYLLKNITKT